MRLPITAAMMLISATASTASPVRHSGIYRGDLSEITPPTRFQGDAGAVVIFSSQAIQKYCPEGSISCVLVMKDGAKLILAPNPCPLATVDLYAGLICHEIGHINGWPATHGK
jgi:hypothetical protein